MDRGAELLLGCLKREEDCLKIARLRGYAVGDWDALLDIAGSHGTGAFLYNTLKPFTPELDLPVATLEHLRAAYYSATARNMRLYRQLLQAVNLFNKHDIQVILLKGAHLAEAIYGNIALRSMSDVDLLVRQEDIKKLHTLLLSDGYRFAYGDALSTTKHLAPYRKDKGVSLEIHFHITDPPYADRIDIVRMWDRARTDRFQGVDVLTLSHEDLFLHLCLHSALEHGFEMGLVSCLDIVAFIEHCSEDTDWELLWERGKVWGIERSVYLMTALVERMLGITMPAQIAAKIETKGEALQALVAAEEMIFSRGAGTTRYLARLFGKQGLLVKLDYIKQRVFPAGSAFYQGEERVEDRNVLQKFRHYYLRLRDLLKMHGKTFWRGLLGNRETLAAIKAQNERNNLRDWLKGGIIFKVY